MLASTRLKTWQYTCKNFVKSPYAGHPYLSYGAAYKVSADNHISTGGTTLAATDRVTLTGMLNHHARPTPTVLSKKRMLFFSQTKKKKKKKRVVDTHVLQSLQPNTDMETINSI